MQSGHGLNQGGVLVDSQRPQGLHRHPDPLSRLSEQTLLVEKLSAQKEQGERAMLTLKSDIQKLVCGGVWGGGK